MSASRSAQLLETGRLLWLVLDYGTVCNQILLCATRCHGFVKKSKHFCVRDKNDRRTVLHTVGLLISYPF